MLNIVLYFAKDLSIDWDFQVQYFSTIVKFDAFVAFPYSLAQDKFWLFWGGCE
jgi:hypothetical protein